MASRWSCSAEDLAVPPVVRPGSQLATFEEHARLILGGRSLPQHGDRRSSKAYREHKGLHPGGLLRLPLLPDQAIETAGIVAFAERRVMAPTLDRNGCAARWSTTDGWSCSAGQGLLNMPRGRSSASDGSRQAVVRRPARQARRRAAARSSPPPDVPADRRFAVGTGTQGFRISRWRCRTTCACATRFATPRACACTRTDGIEACEHQVDGQQPLAGILSAQAPPLFLLRTLAQVADDRIGPDPRIRP